MHRGAIRSEAGTTLPRAVSVLTHGPPQQSTVQIYAARTFRDCSARNLRKAFAGRAARGSDLPHGVHVRGRQAGAAHRGTVVGSHNSFGQEEVTK